MLFYCGFTTEFSLLFKLLFYARILFFLMGKYIAIFLKYVLKIQLNSRIYFRRCIYFEKIKKKHLYL